MIMVLVSPWGKYVPNASFCLRIMVVQLFDMALNMGISNQKYLEEFWKSMVLYKEPESVPKGKFADEWIGFMEVEEFSSNDAYRLIGVISKHNSRLLKLKQLPLR
ncbi:hypothetical protein RMATCC62417_03393 [Rhizopus microsporus]|nr:hypothetical protein RMATCC62417_03393 [Rhizopus microsporus]